MAARKKPIKHVPPKQRTKPKDPKKVASMNANRLVTIRLRQRHYVNGIAYGPGEVKVSYSLACAMASTEGHADIVEEQFQGTKAAIIGARTPRGVSVIPVPSETFDQEWTRPDAIVADRVSGNKYGQDTGTGNKF